MMRGQSHRRTFGRACCSTVADCTLARERIDTVGAHPAVQTRVGSAIISIYKTKKMVIAGAAC